MTLDELEVLLIEQKRIVIEKLRGSTAYYNAKSTEGQQWSLDIDEDKFKKVGMDARYPNDFQVLSKYIKRN